MIKQGHLSRVKISRLKVFRDHRGWLVEIMKMKRLDNNSLAQIFVTVANPGKIKGNHYHTRKREWFCVIAGEAELILRDIQNGHTRKISMSGKTPKLVEIPPRVGHAIRNCGKGTMALLVCSNEIFDPKKPDTYSCSILE